jgi:hypothetical protein
MLDGDDKGQAALRSFATMNSPDRIRWREPFGARAHRARERIRSRWLFIALGGATIPVVGITLLVIWCRGTDEPVRPMLPLLLLLFGAIIAALLSLELFLPHNIRLGDRSIFVSDPRTVNWIPYAKLGRCEISSSPYPQFLGYGRDSNVLFAIYLDPRIDPESLRVLLSKKGVPFSAAPPAPSGM